MNQNILKEVLKSRLIIMSFTMFHTAMYISVESW